MMDWFWGHKSTAIFDAWSIEHVLAGLSIGAFVVKASARLAARYGVEENQALRTHLDVLMVLLVSFLWETTEHYLEVGLLGPAVAGWFAGVENWGNRILTDPLMVLIGYLLVRSRPRLVWPARSLSAAWLFVHVVLFPHSMYLHELDWTSVNEPILLIAGLLAGAIVVGSLAPWRQCSAAVAAARAFFFRARATPAAGRALLDRQGAAEHA